VISYSSTNRTTLAEMSPKIRPAYCAGGEERRRGGGVGVPRTAVSSTGPLYRLCSIRTRGELVDGTDLVMKPIQPTDLLKRIREMLDA